MLFTRYVMSEMHEQNFVVSGKDVIKIEIYSRLYKIQNFLNVPFFQYHVVLH